MELILVDENDVPTGTMEKMAVHRKALLHRAFSVFIFNSRGEMLLQQRAAGKYHSAGLWTNACCSHPISGQQTGEAAEKRLQEEMGFTVPLQKAFSFTYKASLENGLTEHEFDHVFIGTYDGAISVDAAEVADWNFMNMTELKESISAHPRKYSEWFKIAFPKVEEYLATCTTSRQLS